MSANQHEKPTVSVCFPVYRDENTLEIVAAKAMSVLSDVASRYEIIIVNDASPDRSGEVADNLAERHKEIRVIHHETNRGYGSAVRSGLLAARYDWICQTDGDNEYEIGDLRRLLKLCAFYDLIITFRYVKLYSSFRIVVSWLYNALVRFLFQTRYRDISTGLRLVRRHILTEIVLTSDSPFVGAELAIKAMLMGYRVGEVGIQTFPREFGRGASVTIPNIIATVKDMIRNYRAIFSRDYLLPPERKRELR